MAKKFKKDPEAVSDYSIDWSTWLQDGDVLAESEWTIPSGVTKVTDSFSDTAVLIRVSGGTVGTSYQLTNHVISEAGLEDDWTITLVMVER